MSDYNPSDPAIYGPVNGVFVTLSQFQAWQQQTFAANQQLASDEFTAAEKTFGVSAPNPFVVPPPVTTPPPATPPPATGSKGGAGSHIQAGGGIGDYCLYYPDDPICEFYGGGIPISGGGGGGTVNETIIVEGLSGADVNGAIDNGLSAVWSAVVGSVDAVLAAAIASIQGALTGIGNAIKAAYAILSRLSGFILNLLKSLLHDVVAGIIHVLQDVRDLFKHLVDDVLKPIAGVLGSLRDRLLDLYKRFVRPMLLVLQYIRRVLVILSVFHVGFARKLDAKLADLERRISQPLLVLLQLTNGVANWINLLVTANYLIQKPIWIASLKAYAGSTINAQLNAMNPPPDAAALAALQAKNAAQPASKSYADFDQWATTGTGDGAVTIARYGDEFDAVLQQSF